MGTFHVRVHPIRDNLPNTGGMVLACAGIFRLSAYWTMRCRNRNAFPDVKVYLNAADSLCSV